MSKTDENLKNAFFGESLARNRYSFFAAVARKEGYHYIAKIFEETAINEMRHAKDEFVLAGKLGDGMDRRHLHFLVDRGRMHVECAAEDAGESE